MFDFCLLLKSESVKVSNHTVLSQTAFSVKPLCPLCLCGEEKGFIHHGDAEDTEVAQRNSDKDTAKSAIDNA